MGMLVLYATLILSIIRPQMNFGPKPMAVGVRMGGQPLILTCFCKDCARMHSPHPNQRALFAPKIPSTAVKIDIRC